MDKEHLVDEFGELFSEKELELMDLDEQVHCGGSPIKVISLVVRLLRP